MDRFKVKSKGERLYAKKNKVETLKSKWQEISIGGKLFMLSPFAVLLCYKILDNTISVRYFLLIYGSFGVVLYLILTFFYKGNKPLKFDVWGYVGAFLIFASFCALLNYITLQPVIKVESVVIIDKEESASKSKQHYIFFILNKKNQRFAVSRLTWDSINEGEEIKMYYQESLLGFNIVKELKK